MKLKFDIDCTPEELRGFFGLPEVKPMQDRLMAELEEKMRANLNALDPGDDAEDLAAGGPQGVRADAGDVLLADGARGRQKIAQGNDNGVRHQDTAPPAARMAR